MSHKDDVILVIEASFVGVGVALASVAGRRWYRSHPTNEHTASELTLLVHQALAENDVKLEDISGLAVGVGPGSFTGIKIGLAFAYGLVGGLPEGKRPKILGSSGLSLLAKYYKAAVLLPQTRTHGFLAIPNEKCQLVTLDQIASKVGNTPLYCFGDWPQLSRVTDHSCQNLDQGDALGKVLVALCDEAIISWPSQFVDTVPEPQYLRLSTAEERLLELRQGKEIKHGT